MRSSMTKYCAGFFLTLAIFSCQSTPDAEIAESPERNLRLAPEALIQVDEVSDTAWDLPELILPQASPPAPVPEVPGGIASLPLAPESPLPESLDRPQAQAQSESYRPSPGAPPVTDASQEPAESPSSRPQDSDGDGVPGNTIPVSTSEPPASTRAVLPLPEPRASTEEDSFGLVEAEGPVLLPPAEAVPLLGGAGDLSPQNFRQTNTPQTQLSGLSELRVRSGETVIIRLEPGSWLFTPPVPLVEDLQFLSRERNGNQSVFRFRPLAQGTYDLEFLRQDPESGESLQHNVRLAVVGTEEEGLENDLVLNPLGEIRPGQAASEDSSPSTRSNADSTLNPQNPGTEASSAVTSRESVTPTMSPAEQLDRARTHWLRHEDEAAWNQLAPLLVPGQELLEESLELGLNVLMRQDNLEELSSLLNLYESEDLSPEADTLLGVADYLQSRGRLSRALDFLQDHEALFQGPRLRDRYLFLLAGLLEREGPQRNLRASLGLYQELLDNFPLSPLWPRANERKQYLNRYFFQIR